MTKFIILGFQRSGTSWLETMLNSHPEILCLGELFYFSSGLVPFLNPRGRKTNFSYRKYVEASKSNRMKHLVNRKKTVVECLDNVYSIQGNHAIGFKLMYDQAKNFSSVVDYVENKQVKVIHLVRKNVLKTLISLYSAKNRKLYHTTKQINPDKIYLPTRFLFYRLKKLARKIKYWDSRFFLSKNYYKIFYEDVLNDTKLHMHKILKFLEVKDNIRLSSSLRKINPEKIENILINYEEVEKLLKDSPYEWCLR